MAKIQLERRVKIFSLKYYHKCVTLFVRFTVGLPVERSSFTTVVRTEHLKNNNIFTVMKLMAGHFVWCCGTDCIYDNFYGVMC